MKTNVLIQSHYRWFVAVTNTASVIVQLLHLRKQL